MAIFAISATMEVFLRAVGKYALVVQRVAQERKNRSCMRKMAVVFGQQPVMVA